MATPEERIARDRYQRERAQMKRAEAKLYPVILDSYTAALDRLASTGSVTVPQESRLALAAQLAGVWRGALRLGSSYAMEDEPKGFHSPETKADGELSWLEQLIRDFIQRFAAMKVQQIMDTTMYQIRLGIAKGIEDGVGQEGVAKRILERAPQIARTRARVIARTEVHQAAMFASRQMAEQAIEPMNRRWLSVYDHRTRDFGEGDGKADWANHRVMNEVTVGPNEMFMVPNKFGGHDIMNGPGDPNAPAYQVVNCRCTLIYRRVGRPWPKREDG